MSLSLRENPMEQIVWLFGLLENKSVLFSLLRHLFVFVPSEHLIGNQNKKFFLRSVGTFDL
jgi:hypothetical protein